MVDIPTLLRNKPAVVVLSLAIGSLLFYMVMGLLGLFVFLLVWFNKVILGWAIIPGELGIDLVMPSIILVAIVHGPVIGFIYGFPVLLFLVDFLEMTISPPQERLWPLFLPTTTRIVTGIAGALAGYLYTLVPLVLIAFICVMFRNVVITIADILTQAENPLTWFRPKFIFSIVFVTLFILYLQNNAFSFLGIV